MANVNSGSLATANAVGMNNVALSPVVSVLTRKIVLIGVADATLLAGDLTADEPFRVFNAGAVGTLCGTGTMIHRLAQKSFKGSGGIETWVIPQDEGGTDVAATGTITVTVSTVKAGDIYIYISGDGDNVVKASIATGATDAEIATAIAAAINKNKNLPVTASATLAVVTLTSVSKGAWGNDITIVPGLGGESLPSGVSLAVVDMTGGSGVADISTALEAMGVGDSSNEEHFTALIHGYGKDTATLDAISQYVGEGNTLEGCYDELVGRPFRSLCGDVTNDLAISITVADLRTEDRANGSVHVPNSPNHPAEIAALAMALMESANIERAAAGYIDIVLDGVFPGATRWTDQYDNRDAAVKGGLSTTTVKNGKVYMQDMVTYYRPVTVAVENNGYRRMRDICLTQNVINAIRNFFDQDEWKNINVVQSAARVRNPQEKAKSKDIQSVKDGILYLGGQFRDLAWIFSIDSVVNGLKKPDAVVMRPGGTGFDYKMELIYSGAGGITAGDIRFDVNFRVGGN